MTTTMRGGWGEALWLLLKLARPRTWCFIVSMFVFAYASTGHVEVLPFAAGVVIFCAMTAASNLVNIWTDREADAINLPHRAVWVARIGDDRLLCAIVACYAALVILPWVGGLAFAVVVLIGAGISLAYSLGPRLKAHPLFALVAFATGVTVPFIGGWVIVEPVWTVSPVLLVVAWFFFAYGTLKNLPDIEGDRASGTVTFFTMFSRSRAALLSGALLASPYLLLLGLILAGVLEPRYLITFLFVPLLAWVVYRTARAATPEAREATHALGYLYQLGFFLTLLLLYYTSPLTILSAAIIAIVGIGADALQIDSRPYRLRWSSLTGTQ